MNHLNNAARFGQRVWYIVDAKEKVAGRLAARIVPLLIGKHKPTYNPSIDSGDHVVVLNSKYVHLTGDKWDRKVYRWHTGYPGGLKEWRAKDIHEKDPTDIIRRAVWRMLPKNSMRKDRLRRLHIYPFEDHPHLAQVPHMVHYDPLGEDAVYSELPY
eukprot:GEZU01038846.1.p1 GENE.GEZU01038846.1~~GEZU01038846.1.p1  ORF type:complete len:157 (+),score=25.74 GEZU01038846.1:26-496(+)